MSVRDIISGDPIWALQSEPSGRENLATFSEFILGFEPARLVWRGQ